MSQQQMHCLVMAGGQGTRFWPQSTSKKPKQYLNLFSEKSLLAETLERFDGLVDPENRYVVTVEDQVPMVQELASAMMSEKGIIIEPEGRNTAPCIFLALIQLLSQGAKPDDIVAIVPADHVILNRKGFQACLNRAQRLAHEDQKIVTIGIVPTFPHTGYGYIKKGIQKGGEGFVVDAFKEKPDAELAVEYLKSGDYLWNAGMFVTPIGLMLKELENLAPEIAGHYDALLDGIENFEKLKKFYSQVPADSIDCAVMEKSEKVMVIPSEFDWNDLGSWTALEDVVSPSNENILVGKGGQHYSQDSKDNIVYAPDQLICLHGVKDMILVSNRDVLMLMPKKDSQEVKKIRNWVGEQEELKHLT
jgi:mannose-1-phosphate guanylyltransferase